MSLSNQIKKDIIEAMKAGNTQTRDILRLVSSKANLMAKEDLNRPVEDRSAASDADMLLAIQRQIKQNKEVIEIYAREGKDFLKDQQEVDILSVYLPTQMNENEITALVTKIISEETNKGSVMKALSKYRDNMDMKLASSIVNKLMV